MQIPLNPCPDLQLIFNYAINCSEICKEIVSEYGLTSSSFTNGYTFLTQSLGSSLL
jgi:hypothetical protein